MGVGEATEVATGAVRPAGADRVIPYEVADRDGELISGTAGKAHIRRAGEYVHAGHELLPVGHALTAAAVGLAASVGLDTVTVRRRPRVQLLVTGDEVVRAGVPPHGHVRDAIAPMLGPLLAAWGADQLTTCWVPDHPHDALDTEVEAALGAGDVIVVCGSSSVGPADTLRSTLTVLAAAVHVNGVDCRPGHPQALAQLGDRWLVGLPGNPHAALVAAVTLLQPALRGLLGQPLPEPQHTALTGRIPAGGNTTHLVPVRREHSHATVLDGSHPGYLGAAALADAFAVIPPTWQPDQPVELIPIT
jgi:molybdopterin molybdotransferase